MTSPAHAILLGSALWARARISRHDRWTRNDLLAYEARRLAELRAFAIARSPFYRDLHRGLEDAPLAALPSVTKATLMERFDDLVTDRAVRLADVEAYLTHASATDRFMGRYRVEVTGGTTGRRGVFLHDPAEWTTILASYARSRDWAGVGLSLTKRLRVAFVASRNPTHQSSIVGATSASRLVPTLRLDAIDPFAHIVASLNEFRPALLVGYASVLRMLADEQLAGRLHIELEAVMNGGEMLTDDTRARIRAAFGVQPTNVYTATETAVIASECREGHLHRYEDLVIAEIVDEGNRPVPDGETGARLLVTALFSRTLPLIRYELSDRVTAAASPPPVDLPFGILAGIEGREEEVLQLAGVAVHWKVFNEAFERLPVAGWQVIDEEGGLRVLLAGTHGVDSARVAESVQRSLAAVGVAGVRVTVEPVAAIPRTGLGKAPLVRRAPDSMAGTSPHA